MKITNYFDVCGTLYTVNTTFSFIKFYHKNNKNYIRWLFCLLINSVIGKFLHRYLGFSIRRYFIRSLKGESRTRLMNSAEDYFKLDLSKTKKVLNVHTFFNECLSNDSDIILLSASIDPIITVIALHYGIKFHCTQLEYINDVCMGNIKSDLKGVKNLYINTLKEESIFYSDNLDDLICAPLVKKYYFIKKNKNIKLENYDNVEVINI